VNIVFEPVQACRAIWTDAGHQRSKVCGVGEGEEREIQIDQGEEVGFVVVATRGFVFFEVAVVEFWVGSVEGWLCCIGDCLQSIRSLVTFI